MKMTRRRLLLEGGAIAAAAALGMAGRSTLDRRTRAAAMAEAAASAAEGRVARFPAVVNGRPKRNIVLIVADACRGDRIGGYIPPRGQKLSLTPFLDEWMKGGTYYENAIAASSWTPMSMLSMFYGAAPDKIFYDYRAVEGLDGQESLAERLKKTGLLHDERLRKQPARLSGSPPRV